MDFEPWSPEWKADELESLKDEWKDCESCLLHSTRNKVVFGSGNPSADILFIGEGPGKSEDETGEPFNGDAGVLLDVLLELAEIDRAHEYITNLVSCRPPENRSPGVLEKKACWHRLANIIYIVDPLLIVPIGVEALQAFASGRDLSIVKRHGEVFSSCHPDFRIPGDQTGMDTPGQVFPRKGRGKKEHTLDYDMIPIVHPSFILREDDIEDGKPKDLSSMSSWSRRTVEDLKKIKHYVDILRARYERPGCPI